jgi:hypothetical protein
MTLRPTGLGAQMTYLPVDADPRAQVGGRAQATTWPVRPGQGMRVYFDGKGGAYDPGYYYGTVDTATAPSKTGIQKLGVDFDMDRTNTKIDLKRSQLYDPGTQPEKPGETDGEVAVAVTEDELPDVGASATPYGLSAEQVRHIKAIYYDGFSYSGRDRMWAQLQAKARADRELDEYTVKRKDGEVTVSRPYGIRYRQLQQYLAAMEHRQLHKRATKAKTTRSFVLPVAPIRRLMADTMSLGKDGGGRAATQQFVIGVIDPSSKWAHAEIFQGKAPTQEQSMQVVVNSLKLLRDGLLEHKPGNAAQVFDANGALEHTLVLASDNGSEFGSGKPAYADALRERLLQEGLVTSAERFKHHFNLASAPTQSAHIERLWSTLRTKLKLAAQANFGGIARKEAVDARKETYNKQDEAAGRGTYGQSKGPDGWTNWVRRAIQAINRERTVGTDLSADEYLRTFVTKGKAAVERKTASGEDAELDKKGEQQLKRQEELTVGTMTRRKDLAKGKAELKGNLKMRPNWSEEVFRVVKVTKQRSKGLGNASFLYQIARTNGDPVKGSYRREELQIVPVMRDKWNPGPSKGRGFIDKLRADGIVSKWDEKHNRPVRDGSTWVEREVDKLPEGSYKGLRREQVMRRLEAYLKQGMGQTDALARLRESLQPKTGPANDGPLAILAKDD